MLHHTRTTLSLTLALIAIASCTSPAPMDNTEEARTGIEAAIEQWMAAFDQGDAAGIAALYTEDAQLLPPNGDIIRGRAAVQEAFQGFIDSGLKVRLDVIEVEGHGDTAHEVGRAIVTSTDGEAMDESKYIVIWKRVGDQWLMHRDIWNSDRPLPAAEEADA